MAKRFFCKKEKKEDVVPLERLQAERIEELKRENHSLNLELARYRARESEITGALSFARAKAKELEQEAKVRFALEYERLETYRAKWTGAVESLEKAESLGEQVIKTEKYLRQCAQEMKQLIEKDIPFDNPPESDYCAENARLEGREDYFGGTETEEDSAAEEGESLSDDEIKGLIRQLMQVDATV